MKHFIRSKTLTIFFEILVAQKPLAWHKKNSLGLSTLLRSGVRGTEASLLLLQDNKTIARYPLRLLHST